MIFFLNFYSFSFISQNDYQIIITGFNPYVSENYFKLFFEKYGTIESINIQQDLEDVHFSTISFSSKEEAQNAIKYANNSYFRGRKIEVEQRKSIKISR